MKWNRIWKRCNTNYGLPAIVETTDSLEIEPLRKKIEEEEKHGKKDISLAIYPVLLEVLQYRPTHLYRFLQNENDRLCEYYANEGHHLREHNYTCIRQN